MKALIVSDNLFEDSELLVPWYRLLEENIEVDIASIKAGPITGKHGYTVLAKHSLEEVDPSSYALLILPGGKAPAELRKNNELLAIVRHFFAENKPVAAICHGPQILVAADVLSGKKATCYKNMAAELKEAGAAYRDKEVVVDNNLITSRIPSDLPAFCREIMRKWRGGIAMPLDRKKLAVIHIVKRELGLSDDDYRDILERETGVRSAKDMDERGFYRLMRSFTASGYYRINKDGLTLRQKLYIKHLLDDLDWDGQHFENFLNKYYKKRALDRLSKREASKVIESLKNILSHSQAN